MIRDILVHLAQGPESDFAASYAVSLAAAYAGHLTGLAVNYEIDVPPFYMGAVPTDFIDIQMRENEAAAANTAARFQDMALAAGVSHEVRTLCASFGAAANAFAEMSRLYDLTLIAQPDPDRLGPEEIFVETALLESGRAVLIVPYVRKTPYVGGRAVVAWDGGRAAARALNEALPLLHRAEIIEIFCTHRANAAPPENSADVVRHLKRHGLDAQLSLLPLGPGADAASAILNEVADHGAELLVMGGYGHSPLRQLVLGGVTRDILASMTVPVLMAN